jgi:hypothetical protein
MVVPQNQRSFQCFNTKLVYFWMVWGYPYGAIFFIILQVEPAWQLAAIADGLCSWTEIFGWADGWWVVSATKN